MTDPELSMLEAHFLAPEHSIVSIDLHATANEPTNGKSTPLMPQQAGHSQRA
ncbi:MAG: hypothetical protein ACREUU_11195 [Gammaproteobacteria bacterium]